jgi:hypothetical protein
MPVTEEVISSVLDVQTSWIYIMLKESVQESIPEKFASRAA